MIELGYLIGNIDKIMPKGYFLNELKYNRIEGVAAISAIDMTDNQPTPFAYVYLSEIAKVEGDSNDEWEKNVNSIVKECLVSSFTDQNADVRSILVGKRYSHWRGGVYTVIMIATLEGVPHVLYRREENERSSETNYLRPVSEFLGSVTVNGTTVKRFDFHSNAPQQSVDYGEGTEEADEK